MNDPSDIVGHKTFATGELCHETGLPVMRHEPLTRAEANALMAAVDAAEKDRIARMPDEESALRTMMDAWIRLKDFGWREGCYCPKDGSLFEVCMLGSTGIFKCSYSGEWPDGYANVQDGGDIYPQHPDGLLWRPIRP